MADQPSPLPSNPTPGTPTPPPRQRSEQDAEIANDVSGARHVIELLQSDALVRTPLSSRGFDTQRIETGLSLQLAAQICFNERQAAMGQQEDCTQKLNNAVTAARKAYSDFRKTVTAVYESKGQRTALGCTGRVSSDLQQFITVATSSYTTAKTAPYQTDLTPFGFSAATLNTHLAALTQINQLREQQTSAMGNAVSATSRRNNAHGVLMDWVRQLRGIASVAFREQPEQAEKLDF